MRYLVLLTMSLIFSFNIFADSDIDTKKCGYQAMKGLYPAPLNITFVATLPANQTYLAAPKTDDGPPFHHVTPAIYVGPFSEETYLYIFQMDFQMCRKSFLSVVKVVNRRCQLHKMVTIKKSEDCEDRLSEE